MKATRRLVYGALGLVLACSGEPTKPPSVSPEFSLVNSTDPTRVLTVGVDAPANLTLTGTVAGIVVVVDNAVIDLSKATVDCSGQTSDPRIGVWIKPGRTHVYVVGGGTGVVENCGTGVLIGPLDPGGGEPGGSNNHVAGLAIRDCSQPILVSNSHDNLVNSNTVPLSPNGISVIGSNPAAAVAGKNQIFDNTAAAGSFVIYISSHGNTIRGNLLAGMADAAIAVDRDSNLISGNHTTALPGEDPPTLGIQLLAGANANTVINNELRAWVAGIDVDGNASGNLIRGNTASAGNPIVGVDAVDRSGNCVNNTWAKNTFRNSDPPCIVGITVDAVLLTSTTIQLEGSVATFNATFTNHSTVRLTDVAIRTWVEQGPISPVLGARRQSRWSLVTCASMPGVLPAGTCTQAGDVTASNSAVGRGTLAVGGARARVELVHVVAGDTVVLDSRAVSITLTAPASGSYWELRASMPTARQQLAGAAGDGTAYAVGGAGGTLNAVVALEAYHPASDNWTTATPMPTARFGHAAGVVNGTLYVAGGIEVFTGALSAAFEAYDPVTNTWTTLAPLPTPRIGLAIGVVNGVLYAVGGVDNSVGYTGVVEAYNPSTNSWTTKAPMPTPRNQLAVGVVNGILYAVGGFNTSGASGAVEAYDPVSNTWSSVASLPTPRFGLTVGSAKGALVAIGGSEMSGLSGVVEIYDPTSNSWKSGLPMPTPRENLAAGVIDGVIYTFGGFGCAPDGCLHLATTEAFHP